MPTTLSSFDSHGLSAVQAGRNRPLLLTNATVHTLDPLIGTLTGADVLIGGGLIVGVGPGIVTAAEDDGAVVVDATGTTILPASLDATVALGTAPRGTGSGTLAPGSDADLVVLADGDAPDPITAFAAVLARPGTLLAVFAAGHIVHWAGLPVAERRVAAFDVTDTSVDAERVGEWIDTEDFLHQELRADGRYDETRGGRAHAFEGRYWISGDRIDYLDDLGFWAFGEFADDALHHAGYTMHRKAAR